MKRLAWLGAALLAVGCGTSSVDVATTEDTKATPATLAKFNVEGAPTVAFEVPGMHCESCVAHVEGILGDQPGVKDVEVDLESKVAKVAVNEKEFDAEKAVAALVDMQFDDAKLITADAATAAAAEAAKSTDEAKDAAPADGNAADAEEKSAKS